jgi:hypothetical protein
LEILLWETLNLNGNRVQRNVTHANKKKKKETRFCNCSVFVTVKEKKNMIKTIRYRCKLKNLTALPDFKLKHEQKGFIDNENPRSIAINTISSTPSIPIPR